MHIKDAASIIRLYTAKFLVQKWLLFITKSELMYQCVGYWFFGIY